LLPQLLLNGIIAGSIYSLVALGFALIYQTARFFHFAHGAIYTLGAYFAFLFYTQLGFDRVIAFPLACVATMALGIGCEVAVYRPMRKRKATDLTLLIASLGLLPSCKTLFPCSGETIQKPCAPMRFFHFTYIAIIPRYSVQSLIDVHRFVCYISIRYKF